MHRQADEVQLVAGDRAHRRPVVPVEIGWHYVDRCVQALNDAS